MPFETLNLLRKPAACAKALAAAQAPHEGLWFSVPFVTMDLNLPKAQALRPNT